MQPGGSVDLVRRAIGGEDCDLLILADETIIDSMLIPKYADGYRIFAGNKMVVSAMVGREINDGNWKEKLLAAGAKFAHMDPYGDPGGYRAMMTMILADRYEAGLSQKLLDHPGHIMLKPGKGPGGNADIDYMFGYYSGAAASGLPFAEFPAVMDLSDEALADVYRTAQFQVDENNVVTGAPISHALTIPLASKNREAAREFAESFLRIDFAANHFVVKGRSVGEWE
jgi:molybdate/tungstate transport system substrate-binding protein